MGSPTRITEISLTDEKIEPSERLKFIELNFLLGTHPLPNPQPGEIHYWNAFSEKKLDVLSLLSRYASLEEADLSPRLVKGPKGKPELKGSELQFNNSTTAGLSIAAVTFQRRVGIDVEKVRLPERWEQLARKYFGDSIAAELGALPDSKRARAFMEHWTLTESWIKALGAGVFSRPEERLPDANHWRAFRLSFEDHTGALVIER